MSFTSVAKVGQMIERKQRIDWFVERTKAKIIIVNLPARYVPKEDTIVLPTDEDFIRYLRLAPNDKYLTLRYYQILFHELIHWSGAGHRLNRFQELLPNGSPAEKYEECVAEYGSCYLVEKFFGAQFLSQMHTNSYVVIHTFGMEDVPGTLKRAKAEAKTAVEYLLAL